MYKQDTLTMSLTDVQEKILAALAYFDLFNYPLSCEEIYLFMQMRCEPEQMQVGLAHLVQLNIVFPIGGYYALKNEDSMVQRRENGGDLASKLLKKAESISNFIIKFPYVRGIAVSGSLSKKFADKDSDIDFFIITAANRLWIARSFLHLLKKFTFLVNKQHYFCMNYFVDEHHTQIVEKNLFTATEIVTLIPLQGDVYFESFFSSNAWTRTYLPNQLLRVATAHPVKRNVVTRIIEAFFNNRLGEAIDNFLRRLTARSWDKKTSSGKLNSRGVLMSMVTDKGFAKPNPTNFQHALIARYNDKISRLSKSIVHPMN